MSLTELQKDAAHSTPAEKPSKGLILSDVAGTLLVEERYGPKPYDTKTVPNTALIDRYNHAIQKGFEVQIVTGGVDSGTYWKYNRSDLEKSSLNPRIIAAARGKEEIEQGKKIYTGVVAVVDDRKEYYIQVVQRTNPQSVHVDPTGLEELDRIIGYQSPAVAFEPKNDGSVA